MLISQSSWKLLGKLISVTDHIVRSASGNQIHQTVEQTCNLRFQTTTFWDGVILLKILN